MMPKLKIFVDTNILIYILDHNESKKRDKAKVLLRTLAHNYIAVVSTQVLQEAYVTAVKKLHMNPIDVKGFLQVLPVHETVTVTSELIYTAMDCSVLNQLSFWDALIVTTATQAACAEIWTEDLNNGQNIMGVKITNPF